MPAMSKSQEVITFKVDKNLLDLMKGVSNRSEFIRAAILSALESICPFCKGSGVFTPQKKEHWDEFLKVHQMTDCKDCHEVKIECVK